MHCVPNVLCAELEINFQNSDYIVNEGDQEGLIILRLREVQNSFNVTLHPVTITEARDSAGRFNVSAFIASVPLDAEATPGKKSIYVNTSEMIQKTHKFAQNTTQVH